MKDKITQYFKEHNLPKPNIINYIGKWAKGECYAVTCGWFKIKHYCVYCINDKITSIRLR